MKTGGNLAGPFGSTGVLVDSSSPIVYTHFVERSNGTLCTGLVRGHFITYYVAGRCNGSICARVDAFNHTTKNFTYYTVPSLAFEHMGAIVYKGELIVAGGRREVDPIDSGSYFVLWVDLSNSSDPKRVLICSLLVHYLNPTLSIVGDRLYIAGGRLAGGVVSIVRMPSLLGFELGESSSIGRLPDLVHGAGASLQNYGFFYGGGRDEATGFVSNSIDYFTCGNGVLALFFSIP